MYFTYLDCLDNGGSTVPICMYVCISKFKLSNNLSPVLHSASEAPKLQPPPSVWVGKRSPAREIPRPRSPGPFRGFLQSLYQQFPGMKEAMVNQVLFDNK